MTGPRLSIIPAGAVVDPRLEGRDLQVLALLGCYADTDHGWCCRSQVQMAKQLGCARSTLQKALERLLDAGWIEWQPQVTQKGGDCSHRYRVVLDHGPAGQKGPEAVFAAFGARLTPAPDAATEAQSGTRADLSAPPRADAWGGTPVPRHGAAPIRTTPSERSEREGGREDEDFDAAGLAAFRKIWPRTPIDDPSAVETAWRGLSAEDRTAALAGVPVFLEALKAQRQTHVPGGANFLAKRRWEAAVAAASGKAAAEAQSARMTCAAWGKRWWGLVIARTLAGDLKRLRLMLSLAEGGTGASADPGELDLAIVDAATGFPSDGKAMGEWRAWFERRGVFLPVWRDKRVWVYLPSADPPWQDRDREDDGDRLAG